MYMEMNALSSRPDGGHGCQGLMEPDMLVSALKQRYTPRTMKRKTPPTPNQFCRRRKVMER